MLKKGKDVKHDWEKNLDAFSMEDYESLAKALERQKGY